jgi:hypothetical protein
MLHLNNEIKTQKGAWAMDHAPTQITFKSTSFNVFVPSMAMSQSGGALVVVVVMWAGVLGSNPRASPPCTYNWCFVITYLIYGMVARDMVLIYVSGALCFKHMVWYYICFKHMCYMILIPIKLYGAFGYGFNIISHLDLCYGFNTKGASVLARSRDRGSHIIYVSRYVSLLTYNMALDHPPPFFFQPFLTIFLTILTHL